MVIRKASASRPRLRNGRLALVSISQGGSTPDPTGGSVAGVADFVAQRVFQRIGTSRELVVSFTYNDVPPAAVEARLVDFTTGAQLTPWDSLTQLAASNGSGSGRMTAPQGCWYRLELRDVAARGTVVRGTLKFGVGIVLGLIGQSNMENAPTTSWFYPLGDHRSIAFKRFDNATYQRIGRTNDSRPASQNAGTYGSSFTAALGDGNPGVTQKAQQGDFFVFVPNIIAAGLNIPVCVIERAVGGSEIASWQAGQTNWTRFETAVAAAGGDVEMVLWYQGETNAKGMNPVTHRAALATVHAQCQALGGRDTSNFHFGVISLGTGAYLGSAPGEFGAMRALLVDYANKTPGAFLAGCAHDAQTGDGVHLNGRSYGRLGPRVGKSALARLGVGVSGAGPFIVGASYANGFVDFALQHTGGTALLDGAGGSGTALTGFEFKDGDGVIVTYGATSFPNANTIRVAVNGVPVTASYAMMNNPHNSDPATSESTVTLASVPCDDVSFLYSTGAPLQPCAAIAVTGG